MKATFVLSSNIKKLLNACISKPQCHDRTSLCVATNENLYLFKKLIPKRDFSG